MERDKKVDKYIAKYVSELKNCIMCTHKVTRPEVSKMTPETRRNSPVARQWIDWQTYKKYEII